MRKKIVFDNQWVAIIGAMGGIGAAICAYLQKHSAAKLLLCDIDQKKLEEYADELRRKGTETEIYAIDLIDARRRMRFFHDVIQKYDVYAMIYSAGLTDLGYSCSSKFADYMRINAVNYLAPMHLILLFNEYFQKKERGGILLINSIAAKAHHPFQNIYANSKAALDSFINALRYENSTRFQKKIIFSQIYPVGVRTNMIVDVLDVLSPIQQKALATPEQIAACAINGFIRGRKYIYQRTIVVMYVRTVFRLFPRFATNQLGSAHYRIQKNHRN